MTRYAPSTLAQQGRSPRSSLSRRKLLKTLGASAALTPFLPILNAGGQELLFPKRLLLFFTPDGTSSIDHGGAVVNWKPAGTEDAFTFHDMHAPLEPHKSKIVLPWGLKMSAGGAGQEHAFGMSGLWSGATLHEPSAGADFDGGNGQRTGWGSGPSVDQIVAAASGPDAPYTRAADDPSQETAFRTLELGAQCAEPHSMHRMIYKGDNQPIHPETNPLAAFERLFAGVMGGETGGEDAAKLRKQAELDILMADVEKLRAMVGSEEYTKIEAHLEGLRAIERRLNGPSTTVGCTVPSEAPEESIVRYENSETFPRDATAMMDLAVHALSCDLTRVASVQLSRGFSNIVHEWAGVTQGHHTVSHLDGDHTAELSAIDKWYATQFAYLLAALDSVVEGDGTLLDNTLVCWGREMGTTSHKMQPINLVLAGGARGGLTGGRFLDRNGEPHAKLLVSICRLMGLDLNGVGDRNPDSGPLAGV
jgi:hypothetical protein